MKSGHVTCAGPPKASQLNVRVTSFAIFPTTEKPQSKHRKCNCKSPEDIQPAQRSPDQDTQVQAPPFHGTPDPGSPGLAQSGWPATTGAQPGLFPARTPALSHHLNGRWVPGVTEPRSAAFMPSLPGRPPHRPAPTPARFWKLLFHPKAGPGTRPFPKERDPHGVQGLRREAAPRTRPTPAGADPSPARPPLPRPKGKLRPREATPQAAPRPERAGVRRCAVAPPRREAGPGRTLPPRRAGQPPRLGPGPGSPRPAPPAVTLLPAAAPRCWARASGRTPLAGRPA